MNAARLKEKLEQIDNRGYKAYRKIKGAFDFPHYTLFVDYVQGDPYATPSRLRARVAQEQAHFDSGLFRNDVRRAALEDYLARVFAAAIEKKVKGRRGSGKSGVISVDSGGQEILERTAAVVNEEYVEIRFVAGLPAAGRRCLGGEARAMFFEEIPSLVESSMVQSALNSDHMRTHVESAEDQDRLRAALEDLGLVAFVEDGSILPRESGVTDKPLRSSRIVRFKSPAQLEVSVELPNRGRVSGMGIPEGVTLIIGGGYHGKSTLLKALERGVYSHIPGDGREGVATRDDAVKIRAEDGRRIEKVNISSFISNLPFISDTTAFSTENASGSTSQAANILEAMEVGARLLLIDEDTSATNFMIRDELMQRLISKDSEPITPFIDQVQSLYKDHGVSTVVVMGGSGDYFEVADTVISMNTYKPQVMTAEAKKVIAERKDMRKKEGGGIFSIAAGRAPLASSIDSRRGRKEKVSVKGLRSIVFGRQTIDMSAVEQLVDISQTRAIGAIIQFGKRQGYFKEGGAGLDDVLGRILADLSRKGMDILMPYSEAREGGEGAGGGHSHDRSNRVSVKGGVDDMFGRDHPHPGDYAMPRKYEIAAAMNRLRSLQVEQM